MKTHKLLLDCDHCGCSVIKIETDFKPDDEPAFILSYYGATFYEKQAPIKTRIRRAIEMIWCAIAGKEYQFFEIVLNTYQMGELGNMTGKAIAPHGLRAQNEHLHAENVHLRRQLEYIKSLQLSIADRDLLMSIDHFALIRYLSANGWELTCKSGEETSIQCFMNENKVRVWVPTDNQNSDYARMMGSVIETLVKTEEKTELQIIDDLDNTYDEDFDIVDDYLDNL